MNRRPIADLRPVSAARAWSGPRWGTCIGLAALAVLIGVAFLAAYVSSPQYLASQAATKTAQLALAAKATPTPKPLPTSPPAPTAKPAASGEDCAKAKSLVLSRPARDGRTVEQQLALAGVIPYDWTVQLDGGGCSVYMLAAQGSSVTTWWWIVRPSIGMVHASTENAKRLE